MLEQNILLNRKNEPSNDFVNYRSLVKKSHVYICTTMYHEADFEMEQLLFSIAGIDRARRNEGRYFESHVWFDDAVRQKTLKSFAIQFISLLPDTVQVSAEDVVKVHTPYGMQLKWTLPGGMPFHVHLKDNFKVRKYLYDFLISCILPFLRLNLWQIPVPFMVIDLVYPENTK